MRKIIFTALAVLMALSASAQEQSKNHFKLYGFIRNYYAFDTRESLAGTEDFFYYLPKDYSYGTDFDASKQDLNEHASFRFAALTSRVGLDVSGYEFKGFKFGAKVETDFYCGLSGSTGTATLRLRQAFATVNRLYENGNSIAFKLGQAWHPMAADMPDIFSLNTGSPFGPFSRTPQVTFDFNAGKFGITAATIWQMQYTSCGPNGADVTKQANSADFIRNGGCEFFVSANYNNGPFLARLGVNYLRISPRYNDGVNKVNEHLNAFSYFLYAQYKKGLFSAKFKTVLAQAGEHVNLNGGYGICDIDSNGNYLYTPSRNSSSWLSLTYGKNWKGILFLGYVRNFGTLESLMGTDRQALGYYFSKNSFANMNRMFRITPTVIKNFGKFDIGLEWEITGVQYGDKSAGQNLANGLYDQGLHWVLNNRIQGLVKFTF